MIIGFPYQDRAQIIKEFDRLMALGPSLTQILIYFAFPGTPFHEQVLAEGRYLPEYQHNPDLRRWDGFAMHFEHPKFEATELEALQKKLYRQDFSRLGPSLVRLMHVWLEGYRNLRNSPNPLLRARAERLRKDVIESLPGLYPAMLFGPSRNSRAQARQLSREIRRELGNLSLGQRLMSWGTLLLATWTWLASKLHIFQQPALLRIEHRVPPTQRRWKAQSTVMRLQGGFNANPLQVLTEDLARNTRNLLALVFPTSFGDNENFPTTAATQPPDSRLQ
jgi:hypothetical protein